MWKSKHVFQRLKMYAYKEVNSCLWANNINVRKLSHRRGDATNQVPCTQSGVWAGSNFNRLETDYGQTEVLCMWDVSLGWIHKEGSLGLFTIHTYCSVPWALRLGRFRQVCICMFWTSMSMGVACWYCVRKSVDGGGGHLGWESDSVQASMRWAMRITSLKVLGPWSRARRVMSGRRRGHKKKSLTCSGMVGSARTRS